MTTTRDYYRSIRRSAGAAPDVARLAGEQEREVQRQIEQCAPARPGRPARKVELPNPKDIHENAARN